MKAIKIITTAHVSLRKFIAVMFVMKIALTTEKPADMLDETKSLKVEELVFVVRKTNLNKQKFIKIFCIKKLSM